MAAGGALAPRGVLCLAGAMLCLWPPAVAQEGASPAPSPAPPAAVAPELAGAGRSTGLPLPRFVSLGADRVHLRFGPGREYPIRWVLARNGLPVEIIAEFDTWRKVRLHDDDEGWIHASLLSSRRTIMVTEAVRELHRTPDDAARVVLRAEPGVIGELVDCEQAWCRVDIQGRRGWLRRDAFWGTLPGEMPN
ncbi:MAG: SH3 domain-containing protein [Geminicoccaceae bacterium]